METYYQRNRQRLLDKQKKYYQEHKEQVIDCVKEWTQKNKEKVNDYQRRYKEAHSEEHREYYADWYKVNGRKRTINDAERILEWRQAFPEKVKIHNQVSAAIKRGEVVKPLACSKCLRKTRLHAHHYNYKHFMNFVWLCASCHKKEHGLK